MSDFEMFIIVLTDVGAASSWSNGANRTVSVRYFPIFFIRVIVNDMLEEGIITTIDHLVMDSAIWKSALESIRKEFT